ncbi:MAG: bifunctional riboflavin kinase/FAD synthetase [Candidatus Coprenecus sp.]|nr:bifunctional riboflavin kinase/FAD synthetase [Candidatus Coprenecus sp.]
MVVAATGFFDGVHTGHRAVLQILKDTARGLGQRSCVITFWPHPRTVLQQDASSLRLLTSIDEKRKLIMEAGIDDFIVIPFNREFSRLDASSFIRKYLIEMYNVSTLVIGYDHRLGNSSCRTREELEEIAHQEGLVTKVVDEKFCGDIEVSSTKIRKVLTDGDVVMASKMLGYNYSLYGVVVLGNMIGRTIGFPTANMQLYEPLKMVPANGVYHVKATVMGKVHDGICNVGNRPTVGKGNERTIETHILNFDEQIYGLDIGIEFVSRIRDERRFSSMEELKTQIESDRESVLSQL